MCSCDFAIMAAGTSTLEAMAAQLPMMLIPIVSHQICPAVACAEKGAAMYVGCLNDLHEIQLLDAFNTMLCAKTRRDQISAIRRLGVDGAGALRVADAIETLLVSSDRTWTQTAVPVSDT